MIVTCERCETQFQLDESRVPEAGARVRCSRCKHAFVVQRPAEGAEDEIHQAARRGAEIGETPDVTRDLPDPRELSGADWQFNVERQESGGPAAPEAPASAEEKDVSEFGLLAPGESLSVASDEIEAESPAETGDSLSLADEPLGADEASDSPFEDSLDEPAPEAPADGGVSRGGPDEWDIFDDLTAPSERPEPEPATGAVVVTEERRAAPEAPAARSPGRSRLRVAPGLWVRAGTLAGWLTTGALCAFGFAGALAPGAERPAMEAVAPGIEVEELRGRWVDHARLGRIYVVSGRLRRAAGEAVSVLPLRLMLRDASGRPLDGSWPLAEPRPPRVLREGRVDALRATTAAFEKALGPGEARAFETVVWPLPPEAARFELAAGSR